MRTYILRRLIAIPLMLLLLSLVLFLLIWTLPGDASFSAALSISDVPNLEVARERLGLDRPWYVQYGDWLGGIFVGDLGESLTPPHDSIMGSVKERLPKTLEVGLLTILLSAVLSVPVGVISAVRRNKPEDYLLRAGTILGISVPNFWTGTLIIIYAFVWFDWNPIQDWVDFTEDPLKNLAIVIFPAGVLAYAGAAYTARIMRSAMLEVLHSDHVRTARAKGLRERVVIFRHVFRSALIPVLTVVGLQLGAILGGAIVAEQIFAIPGMGLFALERLIARDYPAVLMVTMIFAAMFMVVTLLVDVLYTYVDPRIRY
ncbi:MAG: ABC transporter permease [Dehalococcoidia bacterium]|nr:ABC transporter permease [Chloroflexota bacterium]MXX19088.1 ABC transporter permease [Dehalococcoidia bacterium]MCY3604094.1 ABC transporter permease [Chloroflexota bacterium]MCY3647492.1 ABC transporter permease [Chloroflexota bacterium]MDE2934886.1 ABC transporter permease [Chloroflexota bacterium]